MKQMESKAEFTSNNFDGCEVAYPTREPQDKIKKIAPGTIPSASALRIWFANDW